MKKANTIKILEILFDKGGAHNISLRTSIGKDYGKYIYQLRKYWIKIAKYKSATVKGLYYYELIEIPKHIKWEWRTRLEVWEKNWFKRVWAKLVK